MRDQRHREFVLIVSTYRPGTIRSSPPIHYTSQTSLATDKICRLISGVFAHLHAKPVSLTELATYFINVELQADQDLRSDKRHSGAATFRRRFPALNAHCLAQNYLPPGSHGGTICCKPRIRSGISTRSSSDRLNVKNEKPSARFDQGSASPISVRQVVALARNDLCSRDEGIDAPLPGPPQLCATISAMSLPHSPTARASGCSEPFKILKPMKPRTFSFQAACFTTRDEMRIRQRSDSTHLISA